MARNMLIEKTFENRGYTSDFIRDIDVVKPQVLKDADVLCARLDAIKSAGRHIVFIPDFDMDGIMSGVIGFAGLSELGFRVSLYIPDPAQGYGFDVSVIQSIMADYPDCSAIMTGDVGVTCHEGIAAAKALGIEVLVTDHHLQVGALPMADVVVDPMRNDETYEQPRICGAYVVYQCLQMYADLYCTRYVQEQIRRLRVFAGIGTISDSMPLLFENRPLVRDAVSIARMIYSNGTDFVVNHMPGCDVYRRAFRGLNTILRMFADSGKISKPGDITEIFFGYYLAPVFNSVKRIGTDMQDAFGVFFGAEVQANAAKLFALNNERKALVERYLVELTSADQPFAPYIYWSDAPTGVLGLLAKRMSDMTGLPAAVIRKDDTIHGSGRSPVWYPFVTRTKAVDAYAAGHEVAFGIGFHGDADIKKLYDFLADDVQAVMSQTDMSQYEAKPDFVIAHDGTGDVVIDIVLFLEYLDELQQLRPFGSGFPAPSVLLKFRPDDGDWTILGSTKQHLKIRLDHGLEVLLWNQAPLMEKKDSMKECYVIGHLVKNEFRDIQTVQFVCDADMTYA